jgi:hypothetical protein
MKANFRSNFVVDAQAMPDQEHYEELLFESLRARESAQIAKPGSQIAIAETKRTPWPFDRAAEHRVVDL